MRTPNLILSLLFVFVVSLAQGQGRLSKKDRATIQQVCDQHNAMRKLAFGDTSYNLDQLAAISTDTILQIIQLDRESIRLMRYGKIEFKPDTVTEVWKNLDTVGCRVKNGRSYSLGLIEDAAGWKVSSLNVNYSNRRMLLATQNNLHRTRAHRLKLKQIESNAAAFVEHWNTLNSKGKSTALQKVTSSHCYNILALRNEINVLKGYGKRALELRTVEPAHLNSDTTATCRITIKGHGGTTLMFEKVKDVWIVVGENDHRFSAEKLAKEQNRYQALKQGNEVKKALEAFKDALSPFMLHSNDAPLRAVTSPDFFEHLEIFRNQVSPYDTSMMRTYGPRVGFNVIESLISITDSFATYEMLYHDTIHLKKQKNQWLIAGFNHSSSSKSKVQFNEQHLNILKHRLFNISYSEYNRRNVEVVELAVDDPSEDLVPKVDSTLYHVLSETDKATFPGGTVALYQELTRLLNAQSLKGSKKFKGIVYVQFVIGFSGEILDVKAMNATNTPQAKAAVSAVSQLSNWEQPVNKTPRLQQRVLGVEFR